MQIGTPDAPNRAFGTPNRANWYIYHTKSCKFVHLTCLIAQIGTSILQIGTSCTANRVNLVHLANRCIWQIGTFCTPNRSGDMPNNLLEIGTSGMPNRANWYISLAKSCRLVHVARQIAQIGTWHAKS